MTKEILGPHNTATLQETLAQMHKGDIVLKLDPESYKQPTLESVVGQRFEEAAANKETALSLTKDMERAIKLARDSYNNPSDVEALIATARPPRTETPDEETAPTDEGLLAGFVPLTVLPDNLTRLFRHDTRSDKSEQLPMADRLAEAVTLWRETTAKRREALEILQKGSNGAYTEAELALARRTSAQAGLSAEHHQRSFTDRYQTVQNTVSAATETLVGSMVDTKQKEASLEGVKKLRNELFGEYFTITTYLEEQAESEGSLWKDRAEELAIVATLKNRAIELAQHITELKHATPDMNNSSSLNPQQTEDEGDLMGLLTPQGEENTNPDQDARAEQVIIERTRLISEAEDRLTSCNNELAAHQKALMSIDAELDGIRERTLPYVHREHELQQRICEELVVPVILATTPEVEATIGTFRDMRARHGAQFDELPKLIRDYAVAELWLQEEFAPRVMRQLKKMDPERYAAFTTSDDDEDDGPVATGEIRRFMKIIGIVILNRKETFSDRIFNASREYGSSVAQKAYDTANANLQDTLSMMRTSANIAYTGAVFRQELTETGTELDTDVVAAIRELDDCAKEVERAVGEAELALASIANSFIDEYRYADEMRDTLLRYQNAQNETSTELARGEKATSRQRELELTRRDSIRKIAGLTPTDPGETVELPTSDNYRDTIVLSAEAQSADARAEHQAERAQMLHDEAWRHYGKLDAQLAITVERVATLYKTRADLFKALERAAASGEQAIHKAYDTVEEMIHAHENLPIPRAISEADTHREFLALTGGPVHTIDTRRRPHLRSSIQARGRMIIEVLGLHKSAQVKGK